MELSPHALRKEWTDLKLRPVYFLGGDETYPKDRFLKSLKAKTQADDFNFEEFSGEGLDAARLVASCNTPPVFQDRRLVVVRHAEKMLAGPRALLAEYCAAPMETTTLVLLAHGAKPKKGDKLIASIDKGKGGVVMFYPKGQDEAVEWAQARLKKLGREAEQDALEWIVEGAGTDLEILEQELEKLVFFTKGLRGKISIEQARESLAYRREENPFEIGKLYYLRQGRKALKTLDRLLEEGQSEFFLISQIAHTFEKLLHAKRLLRAGQSENQILYKLRMFPRFHPQFLGAAKRWSEPDLRRALKSSLELDGAWKSGAADDARASLHRLTIDVLG